MDLLEKRTAPENHDGSPPSEQASSEVAVEYDEGEFTAAEDMRELSDANLRDLQVKCGQTTVHLSTSRAEAIGPTVVNDLIENAWARSRQTRKRPRSVEERSGLVYLSLGVALLAVAFVVAIETSADRVVLFIMLGYVVGLSCSVLILALNRPISWGYALIVPFSQDELRRQARSRSKWPIVSVVIAALALIVSLTFNLINYLSQP